MAIVKCERCGRRAPLIDDPDFLEWFGNPDSGDWSGNVCPECITRAERAAHEAEIARPEALSESIAEMVTRLRAMKRDLSTGSVPPDQRSEVVELVDEMTRILARAEGAVVMRDKANGEQS